MLLVRDCSLHSTTGLVLQFGHSSIKAPGILTDYLYKNY